MAKHPSVRISLAGFLVLVTAFASRCQCTSATDQEKTVQYREAHFKGLRNLALVKGVAVDLNGKPLGAVLVEVFDHPEIALRRAKTSAPDASGQHRLAACFSDTKGRFSFDLPAGQYELRCTKAGGWDCTFLIVDIKRGLHQARRLTIPLYVGT